MSDTAFETAAETELTHLADRLEAASERIEVDFEAGVLTVELEDGRQYLLNKHGINREIWLSSPVSGAWHFASDAAGGWRSTRGAESLRAILAAEFGAILGRPVDFD